MKHTLKNPATYFAMLLMALAMALAFLACEEKGKKAEAAPEETSEHLPKTKAECIHKKIGSPITVKATFLRFAEGDVFDPAVFRLDDGKEIDLEYSSEKVNDLKEGDKVSIAYYREQKWSGYDDAEGCHHIDILESLKILPNK